MDIDDWHRIGDMEVARFGTRDLLFDCPDGPYRVHLDEREQDQFVIEHEELSDRWIIATKHSYGTSFRLDGFAAWPIAKTSTDCEQYWFQLFLDDFPRMELWGDGFIARTDRLLHQV